jgi:hypothetical protein
VNEFLIASSDASTFCIWYKFSTIFLFLCIVS